MTPSLACDDGGNEETGEDASCVDDPRLDPYSVGLAKSSGDLSVSFVDADPAPPERGDNAWTVLVEDGAGPLEGATIAVLGWMPDHGHGSTVETDVSSGDSPGEYVLDPVNLFMPGIWEVTITVEHGELVEEVVFTFCIEA